MTTYIAKRLAGMIPVIFVVSLVVFSIIHLLPGDPVTLMLQDAQAMNVEAMERVREHYGLNDPLHVQYWRFISKAVRGDFGLSIQSHRPVMGHILEVYPSTIELTAASMFFSALIGTSLGIVAALRHNSAVDTASMVMALSGVSMPNFWVGLLLLLVFAIKLGWLPITAGEGWQRLILPAATLGWGASGIIARLTRASLLEVMRQEYVTTARAKGLREMVVVLRHALRNAFIPVITILGLQFSGLLGGAAIIETVFARRGLGQLAVHSVLIKDFPTIQGTVLVAALSYMLVNLLVDVLCTWLDPRIRYSEAS